MQSHSRKASIISPHNSCKNGTSLELDLFRLLFRVRFKVRARARTRFAANRNTQSLLLLMALPIHVHQSNRIVSLVVHSVTAIDHYAEVELSVKGPDRMKLQECRSNYHPPIFPSGAIFLRLVKPRLSPGISYD